MSPKDLIALMPGLTPPDLPSELSVHKVRGWTAVMTRPAFGWQRSRKAMLRRAEKRQIWLETLMRAGTVIPILPGTRIAPDALDAMITCNADLLSGLATQLEGRVQYQVILRCNLPEACQVLASQPGPFHGLTEPDRFQAALSDHVLNQLAALPGTDIIRLPVTGDVVANCTLLLPQTSGMSLDQALKEIDALWSAGFSLRLIGPSPAVSFASVGLKPVPLSALNDAAHCLGVSPGAQPDAMRRARREALRQPGAAADQIREAASLLVMASALDNAGPFHLAFVWAEGQASVGTAPQERAA